MRIRCSNPNCESHMEEQYAFCVNVIFDGDRAPVEKPKEIPAEYFECVHCGSRAEDDT